LQSALTDSLQLDWKSRRTVEPVTVTKVTRTSQAPDSNGYGLRFETSDGGRWEMALTGTMGGGEDQ